jgi:hypothetical protein
MEVRPGIGRPLIEELAARRDGRDAAASQPAAQLHGWASGEFAPHGALRRQDPHIETAYIAAVERSIGEKLEKPPTSSCGAFAEQYARARRSTPAPPFHFMGNCFWFGLVS